DRSQEVFPHGCPAHRARGADRHHRRRARALCPDADEDSGEAPSAHRSRPPALRRRRRRRRPEALRPRERGHAVRARRARRGRRLRRQGPLPDRLMIIVLKPDIAPDAPELKRVLDLARNFPGISTEVHRIEGATRALTEVYLLGPTHAVPTRPFEESDAVEKV